MRSRTSTRDFALAAFVIAGIAIMQAAGIVIPASHVYSFGTNSKGELGIGTNTSPLSTIGVAPSGVLSKVRFTSVDGGGNISVGISDDGGVYTWGNGANGGLGYPVNPLKNMERVPQRLTAFSAAPMAVSAGTDHLLAAFDDGSVWAWGQNNTFNQLGRTGTPGTPLKVPFAGQSPGVLVRKVAAGPQDSFVIDDAGKLWAWGSNATNQLGFPGGASFPVIVTTVPPLQDVSAGFGHAVAIAADGSVWAWGLNDRGQAGRNPSVSGSVVAPAAVPGLANIIAVAAGSKASFALAADGSVWAWGEERQLGMGTAISAPLFVPRQVTIGGVPATGITSVAAGNGFAIASRNDGALLAWGIATERVLGLGPGTTPLTSPLVVQSIDGGVSSVAAGETHGFAFAGRPPISSSWSLNQSSVSCNANTTATLTLNGYSIAGLGTADVMLVLDESGSISSSQFAQLKTFAANFVNGLDVGPNATRVGIVQFSTDSRLIIPPTDNKTTVMNYITNLTQRTGYTCIGCGLNTADEALDDNPRVGASRYMVVVTDGVNNVPSQGSAANQQAFLDAAIANAHIENTVIAVGVGSSVDAAELTNVASSVPGLSTVFLTPDFDSLDDLIDILVGSVPGPGATGVDLSVDLGAPNWNIENATPSVAGTTFTKSGNWTFGWTLPTLDSAGASLVMTLRALAGGTHDVPASEVYGDDQNNAYEAGAPQAVAVHGCVSSFVLSPDGVTTQTNSQRQITATLQDDFGSPITNTVVRFRIISGPRASAAYFGQATTNAQGVATTQFTSPIAVTEQVQASLLSNPNLVSNAATFNWVPPNQPPVVHNDIRTAELNGSPSVMVTLNAAQFATDDGLPDPPHGLTYRWNGGALSSGQLIVSLSRGAHPFQLEAFDGALFSGIGVITVVVTDPTPPSVSADVAGTQGQNGWYVSDLSVSFLFDDPESGVTSTNGCQAQAIVTDTASQPLTCTVTNGAGAQRSASVTIKRDATRPAVTVPADVTASAVDANGAVVTYGPATASDAMSGPAGGVQCAPASGSQFAIGTTLVTCSAHDAAGNVGSASFNVTVADTTPPSIVASVSGTPGSNGWFTSPVQIVWTVDDPQSSVNANGCDPVTLSADTPGVTITCSASSAGGSASAHESVKIDKTAPAISTPGPLSTGTIDPSGMIVNYQSSASDAGSGVASFGCVPASGGTFPIGTTHVQCSASDFAGNSSGASFDINVRLMDSTAPSIVPNVAGTPGSNGWYISNVAVSFAVTDGESAITSSNGCSAVTVSSDTAGQAFTCTATSEGGTATESVSVKRDATAPSWSTPGNLSITTTNPGGAAVTFAASASDGGSGVGAASCAPASGSAFPIGTTTVNCTATDNAGNGAGASFTVTVTFGSDEPGRMNGEGHIIADNHKVSFDFAVFETAKKGERGRVDIKIRRGRNGRFDDDRFESRAVEEVVFTNAPSYSPGRNPKTGIDTVVFIGTGKWDRQGGYTYTVTASDRGEPGRNVDTFAIEVKAPNGQVVFSGGGAIADGNVQSSRVKR